MVDIVSAVRSPIRSTQRALNLYRLSHRGDRTASAIALGLRAALLPILTSEEEEWIDRIEKLRNEVNASERPVTRTDYGAGTPSSERTQAEMHAGVEVTDTLGHVSRLASKPPFWCLVLFKLLRTLQPESCVEMGTAVGISAAYQAAALRLNGHGTLSTLEGANTLAGIARNNLTQLGLGMVDVVVGRFNDTLTDVLSNRRPVDYVFIDGHHDEQATLSYFERMLPFLRPAALLVFDDIAWSPGMRRAWSAIVNDQRVAIAIDLGPMGLCVVGPPSTRRRCFRIPLID